MGKTKPNSKFTLPRISQLLLKKKKFWRKSQPVWVYLERDMREAAEVKPYNWKVGEWCKFLREMTIFFRNEAKFKHNRLRREVGPPWFMEFSNIQKNILKGLEECLHRDILDSLPKNTLKSLRDLGFTKKIPKDMLMKTIKESHEDPVIFIWNLYKELYKHTPNVFQSRYDLNAMILMSSVVFLDYDECIETLDKATRMPPPPPPPPKKKKPTYWQPKGVKYPEYLQKITATINSPYPSKKDLLKKKRRPDPGIKVKLQTEESYEKVSGDTSFIKKRIERRIKAQQLERVCNYKFWEPPTGLRAANPKMRSYLLKLKMFKLKARAGYMKHKPPQDNLQYHVGTVTYLMGQPRILIYGVCMLPTEYIPWNGGVVVLSNGERVTNILGFCKYQNCTDEKCENKCDCLNKWEERVMNYVQRTKCKCCHNFDFYNEEKCTEPFFQPPTRYLPHSFDYDRIYEPKKCGDVFIRDEIEKALLSIEPSIVSSGRTADIKDLKLSQLVQSFFAEMADTPLAVIRLPDAHNLIAFKEWVRERIKGAATRKQHKLWKLVSERRWLDLQLIDFRSRAYFIPFTVKEKKLMNWSHIGTIRTMADTLFKDFHKRNGIKLLEQTRFLWPTMRSEACKSKFFHDVFFTYMPSRLQDVYIINPYNPDHKGGLGCTCPLNNM